MKTKLIKLLTTAVLIVAIGWAPMPARGEVWNLGGGYYYAGVQRQLIPYMAARYQRQTMWCWAATIQMVLNYHGCYATQEQIVQRAHGIVQNRGGSMADVVRGLNGYVYDTRGRLSSISAYTYDVPTNDALVTDLSGNHPLIVSMKVSWSDNYNHGYVVVGARFYTDAWGNRIVDYVELLDPAGNTRNRVIQVPGGVFSANCSSIVRIRLARH